MRCHVKDEDFVQVGAPNFEDHGGTIGIVKMAKVKRDLEKKNWISEF